MAPISRERSYFIQCGVFGMSDKIMLSRMIRIAANAHEGQFDLGGHPYILHPLRVMNWNPNFDFAQKCIAVGHDLFEDTWVDEKFLREGFDDRVINGIHSLSKIKGESYAQYKNKVMSNLDAIKVKMCDLRDNSDITRLKGVGPKDLERIQRYALFYTELKDLDNSFTNAFRVPHMVESFRQ